MQKRLFFMNPLLLMAMMAMSPVKALGGKQPRALAGSKWVSGVLSIAGASLIGKYGVQDAGFHELIQLGKEAWSYTAYYGAKSSAQQLAKNVLWGVSSAGRDVVWREHKNKIGVFAGCSLLLWGLWRFLRPGKKQRSKVSAMYSNSNDEDISKFTGLIQSGLANLKNAQKPKNWPG